MELKKYIKNTYKLKIKKMSEEVNYKKTPEPHYYQGKIHGYSARKVVEDFELSTWVAHAVSYLLRAGKKEGSSPEQDIRKAINVLHFELDRLHSESKTRTGGLAETGPRS